MRSPELPLALTMGDPLGIGPEICLKAIAARTTERPLLLIGVPAAIDAARLQIGGGAELPEIAAPEELTQPGAAALLPLAYPEPPSTVARAGEAAYAAIQKAVDYALAGRVAGIVTASHGLCCVRSVLTR